MCLFGPKNSCCNQESASQHPKNSSLLPNAAGRSVCVAPCTNALQPITAREFCKQASQGVPRPKGVTRASQICNRHLSSSLVCVACLRRLVVTGAALAQAARAVSCLSPAEGAGRGRREGMLVFFLLPKHAYEYKLLIRVCFGMLLAASTGQSPTLD